jgi:hypothetical protein
MLRVVLGLGAGTSAQPNWAKLFREMTRKMAVVHMYTIPLFNKGIFIKVVLC